MFKSSFKITFLFLFLLYGCIVRAQSDVADSLEQVFRNTKLSDSVRVKAGLKLVRPFIAQGDTNAGAVAKENLQLALRTKDPLLLAKCHNDLGMYFMFTEKYDRSLGQFEQAEKAIKKKGAYPFYLAAVYANYAALYHNLHMDTTALHYYEQGKEVLDRQDTAAMAVQAKRDLWMGYFRAMYSAATYYQAIRDTLACYDMYVSAERYAKKLGDARVYSALYSGLATISHVKKNFDLTIKYGMESIKYTELSGATGNLPFVYASLSTAYEGKKDYKTSLAYRLMALDLFKQFGKRYWINDSYLGVYKMYAQLGNTEKALEYLQLHLDLDDSLRNEDRLAEIDELTIKYETGKKEAALKELRQENQITVLQSQRKTVLIYSILGGILAVLLIAYFLFRRYKDRKQTELLKLQLEEAEKLLNMEKKAAESELKALKSQMNPHFIFNALNSIQEQFMYGDKLRANEQLENFTYLTRQILTVSGKRLITLATEKEILIRYLELEKMRFGDSFEYSVELSGEIDEDYLQIPPMLIQPFVENAIRHGLLHKEGVKKLSIRFELIEAERCLLCTVEDNGVGRERSAEIKSRNENKHVSFSTESIEQRLELLNKDPDRKDLLEFEDLKDGQGKAAGTRVRVKIPV